MTTLHMQKYAGRTALYRFYDADDRLLYVGITHDTKQRWRQHRRDKFWWSDVVRNDVTWFETRDEASAAEVKAVRDEAPLHDQTHRQADGANTGPRPDDPRAQRDISTVVTGLRGAIDGGTYSHGIRLPRDAVLASQYGVSEAAVGMALAQLCGDRWLAKTGPGKHVVVRQPTA